MLTLRLNGTTRDDHGRSVFLADRSPTYGLPQVLTSTYSDYEGRVDFGLGLTSRTKFRVFELSSPTRIVVDIRH